MPPPPQPAHSDFERHDKMGLSAFEPQLTQKLQVEKGGGRGQKVIKFVFLSTYVDLVWLGLGRVGAAKLQVQGVFFPIVKLKLFVF